MHKICMITHAFYPEYSGAGKQCQVLSSWLAKRNCKIMVATFTNDRFLPSQQWIDGIDVRRIYVEKKRFTGPSTAIKLMSLLVKERKKFGIIHLHGFNRHLLWMVWFNLFLRKKIILKMSMMNYDNPKTIMNKGFFYRFAYNRIAKIIATTTVMLEELKGYPALKGGFIPNGVDVYKFKPVEREKKLKLREELALPVSGRIIIFSGVIGERKGVDILLAAWEKLAREFHDNCPSLLLVGPFESEIRISNQDNEQLKQKMLEMKRSNHDKIILTGMKQNIEDYYRASEIFVLPSHNEGLPNALLEAMACGLICVVTDFPGVNDLAVMDDQSKVIYKVNDEKELYGTLVKALQNNELGNLARQWILSKFSIERIGDLYLKCYQEIIG